MIKNERQYRITRKQAERFTQTLAGLRQRSGEVEGVHPLIARARVDAVRSQLSDLEEQLHEYESLKAGNFEIKDLHVVTELPATLIKARIAQGLSQKALAERLRLKEQQIQRYEATDYASASLTRIQEVVSALGVEANNSAPTTGSR